MSPGHTSKMRFYKTFKECFEKEPYLDHLTNFHARKIITKFRCSDHRLEIEKGRHRNLPVENRICPVCRTDVETELHFLQECAEYNNLRTRYFGNNTSHADWVNILKCKDFATSQKLLHFLEKAFRIRETHVNNTNGQ